MTTHLQKARELFLHAVGKLPAEAWESYIAEACGGDTELQQQVEHLLHVHRKVSNFLEQPAIRQWDTGAFETGPIVETATVGPEDTPGAVIGPYKVLQPIGEGGMGVVCLAEQEKPVRRQVALKIIKPGLDSRQIIARFEAERQTLALMDHVNIARVLDAGTTESGRPFFVMELIHGIPITKYCDDNRLAMRERLELFVPVCQALQHAHQKGIIHRDVKPSNVLVTLCDGKAVPKIIDFGVAKVVGLRLSEQTLCTQYGSIIGTFEYMSPEQAESSALGIDTRSDIYSLGVLLYEMLTGVTALDRQQVRTASYAEIVRLIREEEPPKPSTRLRHSETLPAIAAARKLEPSKLVKFVRGELDWIVMKCLEKDRNRRYETASALAADVQHYLSDETVQACPPSTSYRLQKFLRRNRGPVLAVVLVLLALIGGIVGTAIGFLREEEARQTVEIAQASEHEQRQLAERAERDKTLKLLQALLAQARATRLRHMAGQRYEALDVLRQALRVAQELQLPHQFLLDLRNEVIACLLLPDVRIAQEWEGWPDGSAHLDFDGALERYVRTDRAGGVSICRVGDGSLLAHFKSGLKSPQPQLSADGRFLALCASSRCELWKLDDLTPVLLVPQQDCVAFDFSPNSRRAVLVHPHGTISVYDLAADRPVRQLKTGLYTIAFVAFHPDNQRLALSHGGGVRICDLDSAEAPFDLLQEGAERLAWHPQGRSLAVVRSDQAIHLWDVAERREVRYLQRWKNNGLRITFNQTGELLASYGWEHMLRLWDPLSGHEILHTPARFTGVSLRFGPNGRVLAADIKEDKLNFLEINLAPECRRLLINPSQGKSPFGPFSVHPDGRILASCTPDGFGLWDMRTREQLLAPIHIGSLDDVLFEPSGALLTAGPSGNFRWPLQSDSASVGTIRLGPPQRLALPATERTQIACSRDGRVLASANGEGGWVLRPDRSAPLIRLKPHEDARAIAVSPDGRWVVTGSREGTGARVWDARTGRLEKELLATEGHVHVRFSPDGRWLACRGNGLRLWEVGTWREGIVLDGIPEAAFAFSPTEKLLAMETGYGTLRLVDPKTGQDYARMEEPDQVKAAWVCFSPDGTQLLTVGAGSNAWIRVWDLRAIRRQLAAMGLDWDLPPYPPRRDPESVAPLRVILERDGGQKSEDR